MFHYSGHTLTHLLASYGYWAVLAFVAIESTGVPFPGETMLLAALYAGSHQGFHIPLVILAAALAIIASLAVLRQHEQQLAAEAERALPGSLTTGRLRASTPSRPARPPC